jgi:hypothetical protein
MPTFKAETERAIRPANIRLTISCVAPNVVP